MDSHSLSPNLMRRNSSKGLLHYLLNATLMCRHMSNYIIRNSEKLTNMRKSLVENNLKQKLIINVTLLRQLRIFKIRIHTSIHHNLCVYRHSEKKRQSKFVTEVLKTDN